FCGANNADATFGQLNYADAAFSPLLLSHTTKDSSRFGMQFALPPSFIEPKTTHNLDRATSYQYQLPPSAAAAAAQLASAIASASCTSNLQQQQQQQELALSSSRKHAAAMLMPTTTTTASPPFAYLQT